jgi:hypothetical protein
MALAILTAGLAGAGCSTVLGVEADRHVAPDAAGDASTSPSKADPSPWGCLNGPPQRPDAGAQVVVTLTVIDPIQGSHSAYAVYGGSDLVTVNGAWIPDVGVRPCSLLDTTCHYGPTPTPTDEEGKASFVLAGDFHGYFELSSPNLVPATLYPGRLLAGVDDLPARGLTPADLDALSLGTSAWIRDPDAGVGAAIVTIYDCQDHQASDISVAYRHLGPDSLPFYFSGGLPDPRATFTDDFGLAGAINVPSGTETVTAWRTSDGAIIGSAAFDIRPGAISSVFIRARTQ